MTKIQLKYELTKPLDDTLLDRISRVNGVYGIERIILSPGMDSITVEYDASRLNALEVCNSAPRQSRRRHCNGVSPEVCAAILKL